MTNILEKIRQEIAEAEALAQTPIPPVENIKSLEDIRIWIPEMLPKSVYLSGVEDKENSIVLTLRDIFSDELYKTFELDK